MPPRQHRRISKRRDQGRAVVATLNTIFRQSADARLQHVRATGVRLAPDLQVAHVQVALPEGTAHSTLQALAGSAGYVRTALAARLDMRRTPALRFHRDATGAHLESQAALFARIRAARRS